MSSRIGTSLSARSTRHTSVPDVPGIITSRTSTSNGSERASLSGLAPVGDGGHVEAGLLEREGHDVADAGVVVGDKDARAHVRAASTFASCSTNRTVVPRPGSLSMLT